MANSNRLETKGDFKIYNITSPTYCNYVNLYIEGGVERLKRLDYKRHTSKLYDHKASIGEYLKNHPPHTINEAGEIIYQLAVLHPN